LAALNCIIVGCVSVAVDTADQRTGRARAGRVEEVLVRLVAGCANKEAIAFKTLIDGAWNAGFCDDINHQIVGGGVTDTALREG
jgi:hypothetical protein